MVKNLKDLMTRFKDEDTCRKYLLEQRWNGVPQCPYCNFRRSYVIEGGKRFKCANSQCYKKYSVTVGTVFESSNIPLTTWFPAVYLLTAHKKGISSVQLAKDLGVTQKTAWFMMHRIRESMREKEPLMLEKEVQADEKYHGGLEENKHKDKQSKDLREANARKMPIVGLVETGGNAVLRVMPWVTKKNLEDFILKHVPRPATLVTDGLQAYKKIGKKYEHIIVDTSISHKTDGKHKNGIENIWSGLNRMLFGIYHAVSDAHLQRYCDEFAYRFNSRKLVDVFRWQLALQQLDGRLTYKKLIEHGEDTKKSGGYPIEEIETGE